MTCDMWHTFLIIFILFFGGVFFCPVLSVFISVLLTAHVEIFIVSRMREFFLQCNLTQDNLTESIFTKDVFTQIDLTKDDVIKAFFPQGNLE